MSEAQEDKAMSNETNDASKMDLSRRNVLKVAVAGLLAGVAVPLFSHLSSIHAAATGTGRKKVLIVYCSRSGNTREIASQITEAWAAIFLNSGRRALSRRL